MSKTHWKRLINPDYFGAYMLQPGEDITVTIDVVRREIVTGSGGKKEECSVAHLRGQKPWILNATNSKSLQKLYGPYIEDWAGKPVTLFATTTKLAGDTVECLRVRPKVAERKREQLSDERFQSALQNVRAGQFPKERLRAQFDLTAEQERLLDESPAEQGV